MARLPRPAADYVAASIKGHITRLRVHAQQIATLQTGMSALLPGTWAAITLAGGWSNIPGYIPAQARILQNGLTQVIGHVRNGNTSNGIVIGTLAAGFFNTTLARAFPATVMAGAGAVGQVGAGTVTDATVKPSALPVTSVPVSDHTVGGPPYILGPSGTQFQNIPPGSLTGSTALNNNAVVVTTVVSKNTPLITLDTSGHLTITSFDSSVTQFSFSDFIPLTA